jgi:hypothetical protein
MVNRLPLGPGEGGDDMEEWMSQPEQAGPTLDPAVAAEEQALRSEMARLGFIPVDPATLERGDELTQDEWQALYRYHRDPGSLSEQDQVHIIQSIHRYQTWYYADQEVIIHCAREFGYGEGRRN